MKHIKLFENFNEGKAKANPTADENFKPIGPEITYKNEFNETTFIGQIYKEKYQNDRIALEMIGTKGKYKGETILVATINVPSEKIADDEVIIKNYSENEGILDVLIDAKIISKPIRQVSTGHVSAPVCKLLIK